jgi:hypothetical protein
MRNVVILAAAVAGALLAAAPARAQSSARTSGHGKVLQVSPYAGYIRFGDYFEGPVGSTVSNANAPIYGGQLGLRVAPNVSLVGNVAYSKADVEVDVPLLGGLNVGRSSVLLYDAGVQLDVPTGSLPIAPFVQAGVGAIRYDIEQSFLDAQASNLAANVGVGADLALGRSVALRLMAKDYIGRFDFDEASSFDVRGRTAHSWAFTAGLRLDF